MNEQITQKIISFLNTIGISTIEKELPDDTFLPGLSLSNKGIEIDFNKLLYPGDILHEAGHLAVTTTEDRNKIGTPEMPKDWPTQGDEIGAMLWSYAATNYLEIPLHIVFHDKGYKGSSDWLIESYKNDNYIGLPFLEWCGLTLSNEKAIAQNQIAFPHMIKWLRD
jgi:hypothetical protein